MILDDILVKKRQRLKEKKNKVSVDDLKNGIQRQFTRRRSFKKALLCSNGVNIIAEIKKASPSKGIIRHDFDPLKLAQLYEFSEAAAISVLTEKDFFQGSLHYLRIVRDVTARPILRKDFIFDEYQIYETAYMQADAVLLIATILTTEEMSFFIKLLNKFEISALVEVHTKTDLDKALAAGAEIIGINNRNLYTFDVSLETTKDLIRYIPDSVTVVSESGINNHNDIQDLRAVGVNAFLVGESIVRSDNIVDTINCLRGVN